MNSASQLRNRASDVVDAARRFEAAAQSPDSYPGVPDSLAALEEALQLLSAAWYRLAADARPRTDGIPREQEVRVLATLHDVAAAFARAARTCRSGRTKVAPIIERRLAAAGAIPQQADDNRGSSSQGGRVRGAGGARARSLPPATEAHRMGVR